MLELRAGDSRYPTVEFVLDAVARWFKKYRSTHGSYDDLGQCGPEDMVKIARDLGLPASDLRALIVKAPDVANAVSTMLRALSMDPAVLAVGDPATMRDLQRTCILCERKGHCRDEFAKDTAAWHFREFCPNAYTLDALLRQREQLHWH